MNQVKKRLIKSQCFLQLALLSVVLFMTSIPSISQNCLFERTFNDTYLSAVYQAKSINQSDWILVGTIGDYCNPWFSICANRFQIAYITRINCLGETVWKRTFYYETAAFTDLTINPNNEIIAVGHTNGASDIGGDEFLFIYKFDQSGNIISYKEHMDLGLEFNHIELIGNSSVFVSSGNEIIKFNSLFDTVWRTSYPLGPINKIIYQDDFVLLGCDSGIIKMDTSGQIIFQDTSISNLVNGVVSDHSTFFFINEDYLFEVDSILNVIDSLNLSAILRIKSISKSPSGFIIAGNTAATNFPIMQEYDNQFNLLNTYIYQNDSTVASFVASSDNYIILGGEEYTPYDFRTFVKTYDYTGQSVEGISDLGIFDLGLTNYSSQFDRTSGGVDLYDTSIDFYLDVINNGNDTIYSFCGFVEFHCGLSPSDKSYYYKCINSVTLPPGASVNLFYKTLSINDSPQCGRFKTCFHLVGVNDGIDANYSNDYSCTDFLVGINENKYSNKILVYPNPTANNIQITLETKTSGSQSFQFKLYDPLGKILITEQLTEIHNKIEVSTLPNGLYLYELIEGSSNKHVAGKLIVKK